jgi:hypothetical protein
MSKTTVVVGGLLLAALTVGTASAQPAENAENAKGSINPYVYMRDGAGNKLFIETQFWRNDPNYDVRTLKRLSDVMAGLEKLGFKENPDAAQGWGKPENNIVRCRINMESTAKRWRGKSGTIVACEGTGISDAEVRPSEDPKHVALVLDAFNKQFKLAREKLGR